MSIKLVLLKSGDTIIADAKEIISDDNVCGYLLNNPHVIKIASPLLFTNDPDQITDKNIQFLLIGLLQSQNPYQI